MISRMIPKKGRSEAKPAMNDRARFPHGGKTNRAELAKTPTSSYRAETEHRSVNADMQTNRDGGRGRPTRAVIYYRVSTFKQDEKNQMPELRAYCDSRGWKIAREYIDHGVSGGKDSRNDLDAMMREVRARRYDVLLVYSYDRFSRSLPHLIMTMDELGKIGVGFKSYAEDMIDTTTPQGRLVFPIFASLAEWQRTMTSMKTRATLRRLRDDEGVKLGRPPVPEETRAQIYALADEGLSCRKIAARLEWVRASGEYGKRKVDHVSKTAVAKILKERPLNPPLIVAPRVDGASVA